METDTDLIDKLFLELSQFTKAKTKKHLEMELMIEYLRSKLQDLNKAREFCEKHNAGFKWDGNLLVNPNFTIAFQTGNVFSSRDINHLLNTCKQNLK